MRELNVENPTGQANVGSLRLAENENMVMRNEVITQAKVGIQGQYFGPRWIPRNVVKVASSAGIYGKFSIFISISLKSNAVQRSSMVHSIFNNLCGYVERSLKNGS
jgi:hypothetical protein